MSVSVVNGYVCFSACDQAKARQGKDPNAPPGATPDSARTKPHDGQPATLFGGALKDLMSAVNAARDPAPTATRTLDRLA